MRREDHRMPQGECDALLRRAQVVRLGLVDEDGPYVVPVNYGYDGARIYVHGPRAGRRIAAVGEGARVCFEVDEGEVLPADRPCAYTSRFRSVIGWGYARLLEDEAEKLHGLDVIMRHYGSTGAGIPPEKCAVTSVLEISVETLDGKWHNVHDPRPEVSVNRERDDLTIEDLAYDSDGLLPAVVQQDGTGEVLMVAYMNAESVARTMETGLTWFWSRSRGRLWQKGESSGNVQRVRSIRYDCDADCLLVVVDQEGSGACHTGERTCFYRELGGGVAMPVTGASAIGASLDGLFAVLEQRKRDLPEDSYTTRLLSGPQDSLLKKIAEEAGEVIMAAKDADPEHLRYEIGDLVYHLLVVMTREGLTLDDLAAELDGRKK